jgi:excisionase family DNA binding protein
VTGKRRNKPYTTSEAAAVLGVSQRTVIRLCDAGKLVCYWTPGGGQRRIHVTELERFRKRNA